MNKEKHIHKFSALATIKVPLRKYETIEGRAYEQTVGHDILKVRKCVCNAVEAYDLERHLI
jgi:hypothetical protein